MFWDMQREMKAKISPKRSPDRRLRLPSPLGTAYKISNVYIDTPSGSMEPIPLSPLSPRSSRNTVEVAKRYVVGYGMLLLTFCTAALCVFAQHQIGKQDTMYRP